MRVEGVKLAYVNIIIGKEIVYFVGLINVFTKSLNIGVNSVKEELVNTAIGKDVVSSVALIYVYMFELNIIAKCVTWYANTTRKYIIVRYAQNRLNNRGTRGTKGTKGTNEKNMIVLKKNVEIEKY